jgi:hypothetical protein
MSLPTLTLQRYAGELGKALQTVRDWSEGLRAEVMPRLTRQRGGDVSTAIEHACPGEMRITGAGTVVLPAPVEQNRGFLVTLTTESTCTVRTVSGTVAGTTSVTVRAGRSVLLVSDGLSRWQAWVSNAIDSGDTVGVTAHGDLTGLDADDHIHYLLCSGGRSAAYLNSDTYFATGASHAAAGGLRCSNGATNGVWARSSGAASVALVNLTGSVVDVGDATNAVSVRSRASASHSWYTGGTQRAGLSAEEYSVSLDTVTEPAPKTASTNSVYFFRSGNVLCMGTYYGRTTLAPMRIA